MFNEPFLNMCEVEEYYLGVKLLNVSNCILQ